MGPGVQDPIQFKTNVEPYGPPEVEHDKVDVLSKSVAHVIEGWSYLGKAQQHIQSDRGPRCFIRGGSAFVPQARAIRSTCTYK